MRLTEAQIEKLFAFVKKKHVPFYDLQIEIVDHLAQRIEDEIDSTPDLEFEPALQKVYDGFGIFGFAHIVQERQKAIDRMGKKRFYQALKRQLTWPVALRSLLLITIIYSMAISLSAFWFGVLGGGAMIAFGLYLLIREFPLVKVKRKLLFLHNCLGWVSYIFTQVEINLLYHYVSDQASELPLRFPLISSVSMFFGFLAMIAYNEINLSLEKQAREQYPAVFQTS